ncbi:MAG: VOC family protein [Chlorobi bacterium]|nr:VOC family protein [Chlorobiota bacterium]
MKFAHINLIAQDWKKLTRFYTDVFGCQPVYPERDLKGDWIDKLTGIQGSHIKGMHLKLPGCEDGPTLEIFQYEPHKHRTGSHQINRQGFGHIAFKVENVNEMAVRVLNAGGKYYGETVEKEIPGVGILTAVYMEDVEGNIIELQNIKPV